MIPNEPGKYDDLATYCREQAQAKGAIVIVLGGTKGSGFSVQTDPLTLSRLPELLETMAAGIRADLDVRVQEIRAKGAPPAKGTNA